MPDLNEEESSPRTLTSQTLAWEAARALLGLRLDSVEDRIEEAIERGGHEPRAVHQMRVATRRASAALRVFEPLLHERLVRRTRKVLRAIRRAGEEARRCDVQAALLGESLNATSGAVAEACAFAIGRLASERRRSERAIGRLPSRDVPRDIRRARKATLAQLEEGAEAKRSSESLGDLAVRSLPRILEGVRTSAASDLTNMEHVHALRLAGKRLRYDLEILAPGAQREGDLEEPTAALTRMQNRLGSVNDLCDLVERLATWVDEPAHDSMTPARIAEGLRGLLEFQRAALARAHGDAVSQPRLAAVGTTVDEIELAFGLVPPPAAVVVRRPESNSSDVESAQIARR